MVPSEFHNNLNGDKNPEIYQFNIRILLDLLRTVPPEAIELLHPRQLLGLVPGLHVSIKGSGLWPSRWAKEERQSPAAK